MRWYRHSVRYHLLFAGNLLRAGNAWNCFATARKSISSIQAVGQAPHAILSTAQLFNSLDSGCIRTGQITHHDNLISHFGCSGRRSDTPGHHYNGLQIKFLDSGHIRTGQTTHHDNLISHSGCSGRRPDTPGHHYNGLKSNS